jgi:hypothetical protein
VFRKSCSLVFRRFLVQFLAGTSVILRHLEVLHANSEIKSPLELNMEQRNLRTMLSDVGSGNFKRRNVLNRKGAGKPRFLQEVVDRIQEAQLDEILCS